MFELNGSYSDVQKTKTKTANRSPFWLPKIGTLVETIEERCKVGGGGGPNALKYQNPIVISTHKEMLSIQELHLEHLNLSSAMQFPKAALCRARKEIFDPRIELLIIFFVAICS